MSVTFQRGHEEVLLEKFHKTVKSSVESQQELFAETVDDFHTSRNNA